MPQVPSPILPTPDPAETGPAGLNPRQSAIVERARAEGFVAVEALTAAFDVTPQTIRRDIKLLCDLGILRRYYGGASLVTNTHNMEYETRRNLMAAEKAAIGRLVAEHIPDGASLFLNVGTTTEAVARALLGHRGLKVITNNLNLAILLSQGQDFEVSIAGGRIRPDDLAVVGEATVDFINNFRVDFGIIGISGIDFDGTLLDFDFREVKVAQTIIANARTVFLATDHSKFGRRAMVKLGHVSMLDAVFVDHAPPQPMADLLEREQVSVHVAFPGRG